MRKILLLTFVFALGLIFLPGVAKAQYTSPYVYNGNAYLNYAIASQRARQTRKGHSTRKTRKAVSARKKKSVHRRSNRRVSAIENSAGREFYAFDLPKRILIG